MTGHVCNDLVPLELQIMRSDTRFGILRRVRKISSLLLSQSCYPQHGMLQICDLCDCISSQRRFDLFFFSMFARVGLNTCAYPFLASRLSTSVSS